MGKRVLLTGAGGFVGRQIHKALAARGAEITILARKIRIDHSAKTIVTQDAFAESREWWAEACSDIDIVLHAAWYTEPGHYLTSALNLDCLAGTIRLAQGAADAGVPRITGVGTCFEYDLSYGDLSVETPLKPETPYAAAKVAAFQALSQWAAGAGISFLWTRLFFLYGEGEHPRRLVPYLHSRLAAGEQADLTSGTQIRDFLDVADAGRMIADAALSDVEGAMNICSGTPVTVREVAERIADQYGRRDLLCFGARPNNAVDPPRVVGIPSIPVTRAGDGTEIDKTHAPETGAGAAAPDSASDYSHRRRLGARA
ncbi:MAG: NAD(P)-dependent oxidoreductase [Pseudomonadota bacterium]